MHMTFQINKFNDMPRVWKTVFVLALACVALVLGVRVLGPSALGNTTDEHKTIAFTVDMATGPASSWALPRDNTGTPTRKPPLVNWLGAPVVALGLHDEWALKFPALFSGVCVFLLTFFGGSSLYQRLARAHADEDDRRLAGWAAPLGMLAAAAWFASPSAAKHVYFVRPDIVLVMCLTAGWLSSAACLHAPPARARKWALAFWVCVALAALAKGPMAVLLPIHAAVCALAIPGEGTPFGRFARLNWWWGVPIALALPGLWLLVAWRVDPGFVSHELLGRELAGRAGEGSGVFDLPRRLKALGNVPMVFVSRFAPFGVFALLALALPPTRKWRTHPLAPAIYWVVLVLVFNVLFAGRSTSYLTPAYPAAAILGVYLFVRILARLGMPGERRLVIAGCLALLSAIASSAYEGFASRGARTGLGDRLVAFARAADAQVGSDPVVFVGVDLDRFPIASLMGRFQAGEPSADEVARAPWVIEPIDPNREPVVETGELVRTKAQSDEQRSEHTGYALYRNTAD